MRKIAVSITVWAVLAAAVWQRAVETHGSITTTVHFDRENVRILNSRCVACHNEGGLSFPLSTYEETWVKRLPIRTEVLRHHMPPWGAVPGYGEFANDNGLTLRETQFLISWVEGLGPRNAGSVFLNVPGAQAAPPVVRAVPHVGHWQLGEPDLTRPLETVRVAAGAGDVTRRVVVDLGLSAPRHVRALEFMPGDRSAVRAATFTVQSTGRWLGSWTPWYGSTKLPDGVAYRLPAGTRVVAEIHYRSGKDAIEDSSTLGFFFADASAVKARASDLVLEARTAVTSASVATWRTSARLAADTTVWAMKPDVPPGTTSVEVSARLLDGSTQVLLLAQNPSAEWPTPYILKAPVRLRRGTELRFVAQHSTSSAPVRLTISRY
jgi:hypothetical protein